MSFAATGWGSDPWSFRVTVTVVLPPRGTVVSSAEIDEVAAEATGAAKLIAAVCVTVTVSVVSVAV